MKSQILMINNQIPSERPGNETGPSTESSVRSLGKSCKVICPGCRSDRMHMLWTERNTVPDLWIPINSKVFESEVFIRP